MKHIAQSTKKFQQNQTTESDQNLLTEHLKTQQDQAHWKTLNSNKSSQNKISPPNFESDQFQNQK